MDKRDKFKTIKSYALYTLLTVCGFAIPYLGIAFVTLELNVENWEQRLRLFMVLFSVWTSMSLVAYAKVGRE